MGQKPEAINDAHNIARSLVEGIVDDVLKTVVESKDSCCNFLSECFELRSSTHEAILSSVVLQEASIEKMKALENLESWSATHLLNDICYPRPNNLQEMCLLSSSLSSLSKQGDGDYQPPPIREAAAFYRLDLETDKFSRNKIQQNNSVSVSSLNTETSTNELIADLQNDINNLSFDNVHLSDNDADDELQSTFANIDTHELSTMQQPKEYEDVLDARDILQEYRTSDSSLKSQNAFGCDQRTKAMPINRDITHENEAPVDTSNNVNTLQNLQSFQPSNESLHDNLLHSSPKFCQYDNTRYLPLSSSLPPEYLKLVDEGYEKCGQMIIDDLYGYELLSESCHSQELATVVGDSETFNSVGTFPLIDPPDNSFLCTNTPSSLIISINSPSDTRCDFEKPEKEIETITVVADVENNWEEALEVQLNVTEPVKSSETENEDDDDDEGIIQTREYWSNVGLMVEHNVDPTYLGPSLVPGIESIKGMTRVEEKSLKYGPEEEIWVKEQKGFDGNVSQFSTDIEPDVKVNYLSFSERNEKELKKTKPFVTRVTRAISCLFRLKKKSPKHL